MVVWVGIEGVYRVGIGDDGVEDDIGVDGEGVWFWGGWKCVYGGGEEVVGIEGLYGWGVGGIFEGGDVDEG